MSGPAGQYLDSGVSIEETRRRRVPITTDPQPVNLDSAAFGGDFYRYIARAQRLGQWDEATTIMVRDVWLAAFKAGCTFGITSTSALSREDVQTAILLLAETVRKSKP